MSENKKRAGRIGFEQANRLCRTFLRAGQEIFVYADVLEKNGFGAWKPYQDFVASFGNKEDVKVHERCLIELAKLRLAVPWPLRIPPDQAESVYSSSFIAALRATRDEMNGCSEEQLSELHPIDGWRREIDPCRRNMVRLELSSREG